MEMLALSWIEVHLEPSRGFVVGAAFKHLTLICLVDLQNIMERTPMSG